MVVLCKRMGCLPRAGGLLDQDSYHVWLIDKVTAAIDEAEEREHKKAVAKAQSKR